MCITGLWSWLSSNAVSVIAVCALGATFLQAYISRRHNRLSVKPYLTTWEEVSPDGYITFTLHNNGVGPARIKSFEIQVDNEKVLGDKLEPHKKCLDKVFANYPFTWYGSYLGVDYMMPANQEKVLAAIKFTQKCPSKDELESAIKRIKVLIVYESIYKEKDTFDSIKEMQKQVGSRP